MQYNNCNERCNTADNCFKFVSYSDRVKCKSKIQANGSQPEVHIEEQLASSTNASGNISNNQLEISNIRKVVNNGIQKSELVGLQCLT